MTSHGAASGRLKARKKADFESVVESMREHARDDFFLSSRGICDEAIQSVPTASPRAGSSRREQLTIVATARTVRSLSLRTNLVSEKDL